MGSFTTFMAEMIPSEDGGWFMRETFLLSLSSLTFKLVIQSWLVQHDGCGVCECEESMGLFDLEK